MSRIFVANGVAKIPEHGMFGSSRRGLPNWFVFIVTLCICLAGCGAMGDRVSGYYGVRATELMKAAGRGDPEKVRQLIVAGADVNKKNEFGWDALMFALRGGNEEGMPEPDEFGRLLRFDLRPSHKEVIAILLAHGADPDSKENDEGDWTFTPEGVGFFIRGETVLMKAVRQGDTAVVKMLLDAGASPKVYSRDGFNALHFADHAEIAQLLIDRGLNPNQTFLARGGRSGGDMSLIGTNTALINAAQYNNIELMQVLLNAGADPEASGSLGATALHAAAEKGHVEAVRVLIDRKVNVDPVDMGANTPLMDAARRGKLEVVRLLLEAGANPCLEGNRRRTARAKALSTGHTEIATLLEAAEAKVCGARH